MRTLPFFASPLFAAALLLGGCGKPAAAPTGGGAITVTATPTQTAVARGPITATFSAPIPGTPGKRYRIALSTLDAQTYSGPSHFLAAGATKDELRPVEAGTFEVRLLESDGPSCGDGTPGECARNEHIIARSEKITVGPKAE